MTLPNMSFNFYYISAVAFIHIPIPACAIKTTNPGRPRDISFGLPHGKPGAGEMVGKPSAA